MKQITCVGILIVLILLLTIFLVCVSPLFTLIRLVSGTDIEEVFIDNTLDACYVLKKWFKGKNK